MGEHEPEKTIRELVYCFWSDKIKDLDIIPDEKNLKLLGKIAKIGKTEPKKDGFSIEPYPEHGKSMYLPIKESSVDIHTWPEHNYAILTFKSCSSETDFDKVCKFVRRVFKPYKEEKYIREFVINP